MYYVKKIQHTEKKYPDFNTFGVFRFVIRIYNYDISARGAAIISLDP